MYSLLKTNNMLVRVIGDIMSAKYDGNGLNFSFCCCWPVLIEKCQTHTKMCQKIIVPQDIGLDWSSYK